MGSLWEYVVVFWAGVAVTDACEVGADCGEDRICCVICVDVFWCEWYVDVVYVDWV